MKDPDPAAARTRRITAIAAALVVGAAVAIAVTRPPPPVESAESQVSSAAAGAEPPAAAPGAPDTRRPGCRTTLVFDSRQAARALGPLLGSLPALDHDVALVVCLGADESDCDVLARRFAAHFDSPPARFYLLASSANEADGLSSASLCSALYAADGTEIDSHPPATDDRP